MGQLLKVCGCSVAVQMWCCPFQELLIARGQATVRCLSQVLRTTTQCHNVSSAFPGVCIPWVHTASFKLRSAAVDELPRQKTQSGPVLSVAQVCYGSYVLAAACTEPHSTPLQSAMLAVAQPGLLRPCTRHNLACKPRGMTMALV